MKNTVLFECLRQLIRVYVFSEEQYLYASVRANSPTMKFFFEERAIERDQFIDDIERGLDAESAGKGKTLTQLYAWHTHSYGKASLKNIITDMEIFVFVEKALEIVDCLLSEELPQWLRPVLRSQLSKVESNVVSMVYLKTLFKN